MGDEPSLLPGPLPDLIAGRYRIVSRLGVGGMGVVYKAQDLQLNRAVAVKALEERRLNLRGAANRLRIEALAAASLDHPYICKVYELVETPTDTYIVMEFIEGQTLASMLKRGVLSLPQTLQLGREIAEGLANAHARGLVHRDVKPSNVMVTTHGHVKLLDFGVAGTDVESAPKDATRTLAPHATIHGGTPQYMAPEQAAGSPITTRADLFSLGVVLYECLTGQLPFSGTTTFDYMRHVMQSPPRRLDRVAPDTPADLVDLIERCLEKTPADRPESAGAVVSALRRLEDALTAPAGAVRTARQARAGRRWQLAAVAAAVIAAAAVGWRVLGSRALPEDAPRRLRPFVTTSAVESGSQISPDGQWVSFISTAAGASRIMLQRIDGGEPRPLTLGPGQPVSQVWSPDGSQIATVQVVDGTPVLQIYPAFFGGAPAQSISLGPDLARVVLIRWIGRDIYVRLERRGIAGLLLQRIPIDTPGAGVVISDAWKLDGSLRSVDVRADGRAIVAGVSRNGREDLWTLNPDGSALTPLTDDAFFDKDPIWLGQGDRVVFRSNRGGQIDLWQIDVRSRTLTPLTSGEAEDIVESTSADGTIISFRQLMKSANLWTFGAGAAQQLTEDSLSDYSPALSGDGRVVAFQRSQPTPSSGYTILDAKVFVSPFEGRRVADARPIADGFAPDLSGDGHWLAYMQPGDRPARMSLSVRDLRGGSTQRVSGTTALPSLRLSPVEWTTQLTAWSGADLYFVDQPDVCIVRRYTAGSVAAGPPLATAEPDVYLSDLYFSDTGRLGYLAERRGQATVHELNVVTGAVREIATLRGEERGSGIEGRGWLGEQYLLVRTIRVHEDRSDDVEILAVSAGHVRILGRITNVFATTIRLHPARRMLYMTRTEKGTQNVHAFALETGALTPVTQNTLPGVAFSGFQPMGAQGVIGVREERREDLWLIQQTTQPPAAPAGR
jgi:Tol biopolymer transport system component